MKTTNHYKKFIGSFFLISLFSVSILNAQSIDLADDFLDSLDPNLREEIESATDKKEDLELQKLFNAEASIKTNKAILEGIKKQINDLDIRLREASGSDADDLEVYGRNFFSSLQSTFMPINIPNFGSNYMIDVGDEFILLLTGKINKEHTLEVQRDGSLVIPSVGKLSVAGKSLKEVNASLGNLLDRIYYHAVPDFIDLHIANYHWFIFNVADIFITLGIIGLLIVEITKKEKISNNV